MQRRVLTLGLIGALTLGLAVMAAETEAPAKKKRTGERALTGGKARWTRLFNKEMKDLKGWEKVGAAQWTIEKGVLIGRQGPQGEDGELLTVREFDNFELVVVYKVVWPANTGVWFRYQKPDLAYQADILEYKDPEAYSGSVYAPGVKELFLARNLNKELEKKDDWNKLRVVAVGNRIRVFLNKKMVANFTNDRVDRGKIGFQVHRGDEFKNMAIMVKEARLRPVDPAKLKLLKSAPKP